MLELQDCLGRLFTREQLSQDLQEKATRLDSMSEKRGQYHCNRCDSRIDLDLCKLPIGAYYCRECILLGRVRSDQPLYAFSQKPFPPNDVLAWRGQLTSYQETVSKGLLDAVEKQENILVHAVTGAGKTEMIYAVLAKVIDAGGAVCLASPRIDVCLELSQRLKRDFRCQVALLHGESEPYFRTPLVIATTHQLLKFYQAFDLLIVDEVDAFPYVDNPILYHAVERSVKTDGTTIFLTATSTDELDKKVEAGNLKRLSLPRRFHGNPLVVPEKIWLSHFTKQLAKGKIASKLKSFIKQQRQTGFPLLIFVPEIQQGREFAAVLQSYFPNEKVGFVSSATEDRLEIVQQFRKKEVSILVSTTILERGVTFPCVDVYVLEANHRLFSRSGLVQIAGRVGRSMERPTGDLYFFHDGTSTAMKRAIEEICSMNQEAGL